MEPLGRSYANFSSDAPLLRLLGSGLAGGRDAVPWLAPSSELSARRRSQLARLLRAERAEARTARASLLVLLITDGHSEELHEEYQTRRTELGKAGERVLFADIGDPRLVDALFAQILKEQGYRVSADAVREYFRGVDAAPGTVAFRQDCTERIVAALRLGHEPRPFLLFAFVASPGLRVALPIPKAVLVDRATAQRFWRGLCEGCAEDRLIHACPPGTFTTDDEQPLLHEYLHRLSYTLTHDVRPRPAPPSVYPTPNGTTWRQMSLRFKDGETLVAQVKGRPEREVSFTEMGMRDLRTGRPSVQWELLREFADGRGEFGWSMADADRKVQKRKEKLASALMAYFGIEEPPFDWLPNRKVWRSRFVVSHTSGD